MASCPNCGFDLATDGTCSVCGYGQKGGDKEKGSHRGSDKGGQTPKSTRTAPAGAGSGRDTNVTSARRRRRLTIALGAVLGFALLVAGAIVLFRHSGTDRTVASVSPAAGSPTSSSTASSTGARTKRTQKDRSPAAITGAAPATKAAAPTKATTTTGVNATTKAAITTSRVDAPNQKYNPAKYEKNPYFRVAVGASPLAVRASKPLDLYDPARRPVYNLDNLPYPPLTNEKEYVAWMLKHYPTETAHFLRWRWQRASIAVARHRITHRRVLEAFLLTPREWFVRKYNLDKTYSNTAIPIGFGQTISGPDLVSNMTNALDPQPNQKVLEIGTGSGYQSAFLSSLSNYCYTIEIVRPLAEQTNQIYLQHTKAMPQFANIHRRAADGYFGWPKYAPFDRIIVTTGIDHIPPELLRELKPGGIMVIPVGPPTGQVVLKITKTVDKNGQIHLTREDIYHGLRKEIFVPFTAASGGTHNTGGAKRSAK